jgi:hypothetical protein
MFGSPTALGRRTLYVRCHHVRGSRSPGAGDGAPARHVRSLRGGVARHVRSRAVHRARGVGDRRAAAGTGNFDVVLIALTHAVALFLVSYVIGPIVGALLAAVLYTAIVLKPQERIEKRPIDTPELTGIVPAA